MGLLRSAVGPQGRHGPRSPERSGTPESLRSSQDLPLNQKGPGQKAPPPAPQPHPKDAGARGRPICMFYSHKITRGGGAKPRAGPEEPSSGGGMHAGFSGLPHQWAGFQADRHGCRVEGSEGQGPWRGRILVELEVAGQVLLYYLWEEKGGQGWPLPLAPTPSGLSGKAPTRGSSMGPYRFTTQPFLSMRNCRERPCQNGETMGQGDAARGAGGEQAAPHLLPHLGQGWSTLGQGTELWLSGQGPRGRSWPWTQSWPVPPHPHPPTPSLPLPW